MPLYAIEPDKLLDAADRLAPPQAGPGRPPYTARSRAAAPRRQAAIEERHAAFGMGTMIVVLALVLLAAPRTANASVWLERPEKWWR